MICDPIMPEFMITNNSKTKLEYFQSGLSRDQTVKRILRGHNKARFVWQDLQTPKKLIGILIEGEKWEFKVEDIGHLKPIKT